MHGQLRVLNEPCLDIVSASDNPKQARIGCGIITGILDQHFHFATDALQPHRCRQCQDLIGRICRLVILCLQINR